MDRKNFIRAKKDTAKLREILTPLPSWWDDVQPGVIMIVKSVAQACDGRCWHDDYKDSPEACSHFVIQPNSHLLVIEKAITIGHDDLLTEPQIKVLYEDKVLSVTCYGNGYIYNNGLVKFVFPDGNQSGNQQ